MSYCARGKVLFFSIRPRLLFISRRSLHPPPSSVDMSNKKYTRQGVEAAVQLVDCKDEGTWSRIEAQYGQMLAAKGGQELVDLDQFCKDLVQDMKENQSISKEDLLKIVHWKFLKGKPRHALMKHLRANTEASVQQHTKSGFEFADNGDAKQSIIEISKLRGVGPATASAILSHYKPDIFAFMDDEVIECLYEGKRGYTAAIYHKMNDKCNGLALELGKGWDLRKVGRALWTAARIQATGGENFTVSADKEIAASRRPTKRRKKST